METDTSRIIHNLVVKRNKIETYMILKLTKFTGRTRLLQDLLVTKNLSGHTTYILESFEAAPLVTLATLS